MSRSRRWMLAIASALALTGCSESQQSQLLEAVTRDDMVSVEQLLDTPGVDINYQTPRMGQNALTSASSLNRVEMVRLFLSRGANPKISNKQNYTPLMAAAYHGYSEIVTMLLTAGSDVNAVETRYGYTALAYAVLNRQAKVVSLLLDSGADPEIRLKNGFTAKKLAQMKGYEEIVRLLDAHSERGQGARE